MHKFLFSVLAVLCLFVPSVSATNIISLPPEGSGSTSGFVYTADPFAQVGSFTTNDLAFDAFWHPTASKFYVFSRGSSRSVAVYNGTAPFAERAVINNIPNITRAKMSPDGRRIFVLSAALRVFDTADDSEIIGINTGGRPIDVDFALDSSRAFVLNDNGNVVAINTLNNQIIGSITVGNNANTLTVGPTGLIYVTTTSGVYEIDGRSTLAFVGDPIPTVGLNCTRAQFAPDGSRMAVACVAGSSTNFYSIEVITRSISLVTFGQSVNRVRVISNTSALLYSPTGNTVLRAGLIPPLAAPESLSLGGVGLVSGGASLAVSDQFPAANTLFLDGLNSISRVSLFTNTISTTLTQPTPIGRIVFTGPSSTTVAFSLIAITPQQTVAAGQVARPIVVRALDSQSRPIKGLVILFESTSGLQLSASAGETNKDGFASVIATATQASGNYTITASAGGAVTQSFAINVTGGTGGGPGGGPGTPGTAPIEILSGNGQLVFAQRFAPNLLRIKVRDGSGQPLPGATVSWQIQGGGEGTLLSASTTTDSNGETTNQFGTIQFFNDGFTPLKRTTIRAASATGFVDFFVTAYPEVSLFGDQLVPAPTPNIEFLSPAPGATINIGAGGSAPGGQVPQIRARIRSQAFIDQGQPMPNIALIVREPNDPDAITARCTGSSLSNAQGEATCSLVGGARLGAGTIRVCMGNCDAPGREVTYNINVTPGAPATFIKRQGDNQSGAPGTLAPLALRAAVTDSFGNFLPNVTVRIEVIQGEATLEQVVSTTNNQGEFSFLVRFGSTPGEVRIRTSAGDASTIWTLTNNVSVGNFVRVSGDNQTAVVQRPFAQPLVVQLNNAQGAPIANATVAFSVSNGTATLSAANATTNSAGQASVNVTAGAVAGPVTVTATALGRTVVFGLTVVPPGPTITGVTNAAGFAPGVSPCGLATIFGSNIAPNLNGTIFGNSLVGAYPLTLNGVRVNIAGRPAPIVSISRLNGQEQATIQTPCEIPPGPAVVQMNIGEGSGTFNTTVFQAQPGVFESTDSAGAKVGVIIKENGTYMTLENPLERGEKAIGFYTGLGQLLVPTVTNMPGAINNTSVVAAQFIVGINNEGVPVESVTMAPGMVGVYIAIFEVPAGTTPGTNRPYGVASVDSAGNVVFSNGSLVHIR
jgi:adhesin/invasin